MSHNSYVDPGNKFWNCCASEVAEARCPPPVSEERKRTLSERWLLLVEVVESAGTRDSSSVVDAVVLLLLLLLLLLLSPLSSLPLHSAATPLDEEESRSIIRFIIGCFVCVVLLINISCASSSCLVILVMMNQKINERWAALLSSLYLSRVVT